jgi:predicted nucleic acid-binding protein
MDIIYPPELIPFLKNKHLLLDTNVFRDSSSKPAVFASFFNQLKQSEVTLTTIDIVRYELLKGSANNTKYNEKEVLINNIIDVIVPIVPKTYECIYEVIKASDLMEML